MKNVIYTGRVAPAGETGGEMPEKYILTEEANGFALWHSGADGKSLVVFQNSDSEASRYDMIEFAVQRTQQARASRGRAKHDLLDKYRALHDFVSDLIEEEKLTRDKLPDAYDGLVERMVELVGLDPK